MRLVLCSKHELTRNITVIDSYAFALKMTFLVSLVASVILLCVVAPVRLPRLRQGKKQVAAGE